MIYYLLALGMTLATAVSALNAWLPEDDDMLPSEYYIRTSFTLLYGLIAVVLWVVALGT